MRAHRGPRRGLARRPADAKIEALEQIDRYIVAPVFEALQAYPQWRIPVSPDHPTPIRTKTHSHGNVPMAIAGSGILPDGFDRYDDPTAARSSLVFPKAGGRWATLSASCTVHCPGQAWTYRFTVEEMQLTT